MLVNKFIDEIEPKLCQSPGSVGSGSGGHGSDRCGSGSG